MNLFNRDREAYIRPDIPQPIPGGRLRTTVFVSSLRLTAARRRKATKSLRNHHAGRKLLRKLGM